MCRVVTTKKNSHVATYCNLFWDNATTTYIQPTCLDIYDYYYQSIFLHDRRRCRHVLAGIFVKLFSRKNDKHNKIIQNM